MSAPPHKPWYRHLWPWLLMIPPGTAVAGGLTILYLSVSDPYDLAVVDYDQIEHLTAKRFARDAAARARGLTARLGLAETDRDLVRIQLDLRSTAGAAPPDQLVVRFKHATRDTFDRTAELIYDGDRYLGEAALSTGSRYQVEVFPIDLSWRLAGVINGLSQPLTLEPQGGQPAG
jgi:hypothetical protein